MNATPAPLAASPENDTAPHRRGALGLARILAGATLFVFCGLGLSARAAIAVPPPPEIEAQAWLLIDTQSGAVLAERASGMKVEPASLTKLMTAYLVFEALRDGRLKRGQTLALSENGRKAAGARMYLDPNLPALVDDLIKGMVVQSGNDASITLAEGVAGSEAAFATLMNHTAQRLGMRDTFFANATGRPDAAQRSTARDLALLAQALIHDFPEDYKFFALKEFAYAGITQHNRNRLLWLDPHVDGVKTGQTAGAGYNLIASAKRDNRRLVAVVLRAASDSARATESQKLLNYGFQHFETVRLYRGEEPVKVFRVYRGHGSELGVGFLSDFYITVPRGGAPRLKAEVVAKQPIMAPARRGEPVATLRMTYDGEAFASYPLAALQTIPVAGLLGRLWDNLLLMFK